MEIDIERFKRMVSNLPDDGKIRIELIKYYPEKTRRSYEKPIEFLKMGEVLVLKCETLV